MGLGQQEGTLATRPRPSPTGRHPLHGMEMVIVARPGTPEWQTAHDVTVRCTHCCVTVRGNGSVSSVMPCNRSPLRAGV